MKSYVKIIFITLTLVSCIETDIVEDEIILLKITSIDNLENNGAISGLVGDEVSMAAEATNDRGISFTPEITWISTDENVATVSASGVLKLISAGSTEIYAKGYGISSNTLMINVVNTKDQIARIEINATSDQIAIDETIELTAKAFDLDNNEIVNTLFTWSSKNETVASVTNTGLVSGKSNGSATIEAIAEGITGVFNIKVGMSSTRSGNFTGIGGHIVEGSASLSEMNGGGLLLSLSNDFYTIDGPGLYIYLSNNPDIPLGGFEVGALRKNSGADNYAINDITLNQYNYVFIYCKPFGVPFGRADLN